MTAATAKDVMIALDAYPHARQSMSVTKAAQLLARAQIEVGGIASMPRVLLVLDEDDQLIGGLRRRDILRGLEPSFHDTLDDAHPEAHFKSEIDPNLTDLIPAIESQALASKFDKPIGEFVSELRGRVNTDDSLMKVVRELVGKDTHIAAVTDDARVVGVVRTLDVLRAFSEPHD